MRWTSVAVAACVLGVGAVVLPVPSAPAQTTDRAAVRAQAQTTVTPRARARTRITVQRRSFLDLGTEAMPGERRYMDYAFPPTYSPAGVIENTNAYHRDPLPGPFDLPSKNNPWPWTW